MKLLSGLALSLLCACSRGSYSGDEAPTDTPSSGGKGGADDAPLPRDIEFQLKPEWQGSCEKKLVIDVNLGNSPEAFVRAAACQVSGSEPDAAKVTALAKELRSVAHVRRVDVVRRLCDEAGRSCSLQYSDPWQEQVELTTACQRKGTRDLGAVLMYWSDCPSGVNCGMDWANTHAPGMVYPSQLYGFGDVSSGYYNPKNTGFWRRELLDARWSGLQFLALNTFGPDLAQLPSVVDALEDIGGGIQVALFDDTWGWGKMGSPWSQLPSFDDPDAAAGLIFQKWKQFYSIVPSAHWYRYQGKPLVVFYNAGTLKPESKSAATLSKLKELFRSELGEEPFFAIDRAFFQDPATSNVADAQFRWNTFMASEMSHSDMRGVIFDHFMAKWDAIGRENSGRLATSTDLLVKGPELLEQYLNASASSNLAMIATWNDLGEGTGLTRNYDYWYEGEWLPPNAFMKRIRASQCD